MDYFDAVRPGGLPRQQLQVGLKAKTGCLDAERTLLLLAWLAARHRDGAFPEEPAIRSK